MSYYSGSQYQQPAPPPLPPRRPKPPGAVGSPAEAQPHWTYPPPPPGPPPRSPGGWSDQPPPIPPRPPGFGIRNTTAGNRLSPAPQSFPPPPLSPNRQAYSHTLPPPPPMPSSGNLTTPGTQNVNMYLPSLGEPSMMTAQYGSATVPSSSPVVTNPPIMSSVPPPPPGPPLQSSGTIIYPPQDIPPAYNRTTSNVPPSMHHIPSNNNAPATQGPHITVPAYVQGPSSPNPTIQVYAQVPNSQPPVYTPTQENLGDQAMSTSSCSPQLSNLNQATDRSISSSQRQQPVPTPDERPSKPIDDIAATMQSLNINQPAPVPPPPPQLYQQPTNSIPAPSSRTTNPTPISAPPNAPTTHISHNQQSPPQAVQACIDIPVTFTTDWYWHADAPEFWICSKCYADQIWGTRFRDSFQHGRPTDGKPRVCRFSKPRIQGRLFKDAVVSGSLHQPTLLIDFMRYRPTILDCRGTDGVTGEAGIQWYKARGDDIPNFVCCQACYEDVVLASEGLSAYFEPAPPQPKDDPKAVWSCDMAVPYVENEYEARGTKKDSSSSVSAEDWAGFATEAKARISMQPCPGPKSVSTWRRPWFVPTASGLGDLVICAACYCDRVAHFAGEEGRWRQARELSTSAGQRARCALGAFNLRILIGRCHDAEDPGMFWRAVGALRSEELCDAAGLPAEGPWYTLRGDPPGFRVCRACYLCVAEPLNLAPHFQPKALGARDADRGGGKVLCCFNLAHPRLARGFLPGLLEAYFTRDARALGAYAAEYASIPPCPREDDGAAAGGWWFGWVDCAICAECWHEFARHHRPLADRVEFRGQARGEGDKTMCEMYSPRMRKLYLECCGGEAGAEAEAEADPAPLLEYARRRRSVWCRTVLPIRQILFQSRMALDQQHFLNVMSSHYYMAGGLQEIGTTSRYSYSQAGLGTFANHDYLLSAQYGAQAASISAGVCSGANALMVGQLEQQWKAVE